MPDYKKQDRPRTDLNRWLFAGAIVTILNGIGIKLKPIKFAILRSSDR